MFDFFKKKSKGEIEAENISNPNELGRFIKNNPSEVCNLLKNENFIKRLLFNPETVEACRSIFEQNALDGNVNCQEITSQFAKLAAKEISDPKRLKPLLERTIKFGRMAANNGNVTEIKDMPISLAKLAGLLITENGNNWCDNSINYLNEAYQWHIKTADNKDFNSEERAESKALAKKFLEDFKDIIT